MATSTQHAYRIWDLVVIEDSKADAKLILQAFKDEKRRLRLTLLSDGQRATEHLLAEADEVVAYMRPPDLVLLDEPESGVDLENIALIGQAINQLLEKDGVKGQERSTLSPTSSRFQPKAISGVSSPISRVVRLPTRLPPIAS